jgi:type II secretory pathway pseudopilin PulG
MSGVTQLLGNQLRQRLGWLVNQRGITMIEILLVTIIIGFMGQVAATNLLGQLPRKRLQEATNQIVWDLMAARMKAIMQNSNQIKVTFRNTSTYTIWDDTNDNDVVDKGEIIAKTSNLHDDYHDVSVAKPLPNTFAFSSRGAASLVQDIDLNNQGGAFRITVSRNGKATTQKIH